MPTSTAAVVALAVTTLSIQALQIAYVPLVDLEDESMAAAR
jgi:hypothetical protein